MHLDRATLDAWAAERGAGLSGSGPGRYLIRLGDGDTLTTSIGGILYGPAVVEVVVYRDGGWIARAVPTQTPATILLEVGTVV